MILAEAFPGSTLVIVLCFLSAYGLLKGTPPR
ncbi:MAG: hypothetical protein QOJ13_963 [Gaiellales bacterium]|jgi:hypothetical protein|nr:hypothetical protein [Gaiellales bacterium]